MKLILKIFALPVILVLKLFTLIVNAIFLAVFAAGWITCMAEDVCSGLTAFLRS